MLETLKIINEFLSNFVAIKELANSTEEKKYRSKMLDITDKIEKNLSQKKDDSVLDIRPKFYMELSDDNFSVEKTGDTTRLCITIELKNKGLGTASDIEFEPFIDNTDKYFCGARMPIDKYRLWAYFDRTNCSVDEATTFVVAKDFINLENKIPPDDVYFVLKYKDAKQNTYRQLFKFSYGEFGNNKPVFSLRQHDGDPF